MRKSELLSIRSLDFLEEKKKNIHRRVIPGNISIYYSILLCISTRFVHAITTDDRISEAKETRLNNNNHNNNKSNNSYNKSGKKGGYFRAIMF